MFSIFQAMQLDYISTTTTYGEPVVRLYDFDRQQAEQFRDDLKQALDNKQFPLALNDLDYILPRNCYLTLRLSDEDDGITEDSDGNFYCDLRPDTYLNMLERLQPFCLKETKGYAWLYEVDTEIDFLFSPAGSW